MPELPEVETIKRDLEKVILNKKIKEVVINKPGVIKEPSPKKFKEELTGEKVKRVLRRGKVLVFKLREDRFLIIHLRISGWLVYGRMQDKVRVALVFDGGKVLNYMDTRLLGQLRVRKGYEDLKFIQELGPEIFQLTLGQFKEMLKKKKTKIKVLLMDQKFLSGVGNIYAAEALFRARISPQRQAYLLKEKEVKDLFQAIGDVLKEAIKYRGSSVDTYRDIEGKEGKMESRLKVYGRKGQPCYCCKTPIKRSELGGRGTYFCPRCQK